MLGSKKSIKKGLSRTSTIGIVVVVIIIIIVGGYVALLRNGPSASSTTSGSQTTSSTALTGATTSSVASSLSISGSSSSSTTVTQTTSTSSGSTPSVFTFETIDTPRELDPQVSYAEYDYNVLQNAYEGLLWYVGSNSSALTPWLASNYTLSADGKHAYFNLRPNISFADGEQFNSTAVYFSLNRLLIEDGSAPNSFGTQASWIVQQLLNTSLSYILSGVHPYTSQWANEVLAQNFIQITGPLSFTMNLESPNAAFPYLFANQWASIVAPGYVMQHDLSLWKSASPSYSLPYSTLGGNITNQITQYFLDEVSTCGTGASPSGCGTTYLDYSLNGSLAGTGPYEIASYNPNTNNIVLQANPNYWGGPFQFSGGQKIVTTFKTIDLNYVPQLTTRELDLRTAVQNGQAFAAEIPNDHLYDIANRNAWLSNGTLTSTIPGISLYGPYSGFHTDIDLFATNVTDSNTKQFYQFQPFADLRFRLAFADAVNISLINQDINNNVGTVAINGMPPGFPPKGGFNASDVPRYSYNLSAVQNLLLAAMMHPLAQFNFENGTAAPSGLFNNSFGCANLSSKGTCSSPITQSITLTYPTGDSVDENIFSQIAAAVNNVSSTYNMGLTVSVLPLPAGLEVVYGFSGYLYMWSSSADADYPWAIDFTGPLFAPGNIFTGPSGWNLAIMANLYSQSLAATSANNISGVVRTTNLMDEIANQDVQYLWTFYPEFFIPVTSNVHGIYYNAAVYGTIQYFAALT